MAWVQLLASRPSGSVKGCRYRSGSSALAFNIEMTQDQEEEYVSELVGRGMQKSFPREDSKCHPCCGWGVKGLSPEEGENIAGRSGWAGQGLLCPDQCLYS